MGERTLQFHNYLGWWEKNYYENCIRTIIKEENCRLFEKKSVHKRLNYQEITARIKREGPRVLIEFENDRYLRAVS